MARIVINTGPPKRPRRKRKPKPPEIAMPVVIARSPARIKLERRRAKEAEGTEESPRFRR